MAWKPIGYTSASPYLLVQDAEATLTFLETVFGATRLRIHHRSGGSGIQHAEARLDDTIIMMGETPNPSPAHVHVYVADADACFAAAIEAGAQIIQDLKRTDDGDYRGGVADENGTVWWIASQKTQ
ncbi:MAG: VOC family protein [Pseudomonadota bacterium]